MAWETELVETRYGPIRAIRGDLVTEHLRRFGAHQGNELAMVLHRLRPGDRVIDVGAHIGTFAVAFGARVGESGRVSAFESLAGHCRLLEDNVARNGLEGIVEVWQAVITGRGGRFEAEVREGNTAATRFRRADGPLPPLALDDWWQRLQPQRPRIDLIKVDVEGMELEVLESACQILGACRPMLYVEVHRAHLGALGVADLDRFLCERGYRFFRNLGRRNSRRPSFELGRLRQLDQGGPFFDVLAFHEGSPRYPESFRGPGVTVLRLRLWELLLLLPHAELSLRLSLLFFAGHVPFRPLRGVRQLRGILCRRPAAGRGNRGRVLLLLRL